MSFLLSIGMLAFGQEQNRQKMDPAERAAKQTERMSKELNLSQEQAQEVAKYNEMLHAQLHTLKMKDEAERDERRLEAEAIRTEYKSQMQTVLSKDQFIKWESIQQQRMQERKEHRKERKHPPLHEDEK